LVKGKYSRTIVDACAVTERFLLDLKWCLSSGTADLNSCHITNCEEKDMSADNIRGFQHLGLPVTDIARSEDFYRRLGFKTAMKTELPAGDDAIDDAVKVVMMELKGFVLELYQLVGSELAEVRARADGHIDHFALDVQDIDRALQDVRASGLTSLEGAPVFLPFWDKGVKYFSVRGPDGEKVEFNQIIT
jgi:catechol 2,3-dioxygenase-like lactoylglutathione lyase family enzyme